MARAREGSVECTVFWEEPLERRVGEAAQVRSARHSSVFAGSSPGWAAPCSSEGPRGRLAERKPAEYEGVRQSRGEAGSGRGALRAARTPGAAGASGEHPTSPQRARAEGSRGWQEGVEKPRWAAAGAPTPAELHGGPVRTARGAGGARGMGGAVGGSTRRLARGAGGRAGGFREEQAESAGAARGRPSCRQTAVGRRGRGGGNRTLLVTLRERV